MRLPDVLMRVLGPFAFQANSLTRIAEYPWCYHATELVPGMEVIELGAGSSGFQFVLSEAGLRVTSVDPLINPDETVEWRFADRDFQKLNNAMGSDVYFVRQYLQKAALRKEFYHRVFSISVIEHIPQAETYAIMQEIARVLKPGGFLIMTIDLFLDLSPFTSKKQNIWGTNIDIKALVEASGMERVVGDESELHGYAAFDPRVILERADEFFTANLVAAQGIVLQKQR